VISRSPNTIRPAVGRITPLMIRKIVVFPAPLGPINPVIWPEAISAVTSCTA